MNKEIARITQRINYLAKQQERGLITNPITYNREIIRLIERTAKLKNEKKISKPRDMRDYQEVMDSLNKKRTVSK